MQRIDSEGTDADHGGDQHTDQHLQLGRNSEIGEHEISLSRVGETSSISIGRALWQLVSK